MHDLLRTRFSKPRGGSGRRCEFLEWRHPLSALPVAGDPATANAAFVQAVYQDVLGRQADSAELAMETAQVNSGQPRAGLVQQIVYSTEAEADFIQATYQNDLGRNADQLGLNYWIGQMQAGVRNDQIEAAFLASDEFYRRAGSTPGWIESAFQAALGRGPEPQAVTWASSQLQSGASRYDLALALLSSPEATTRTVERDLSKLQIPIDPSAVANFANQLSRGQLTEQQLNIAYLSSSQYFDLQTGVPVTTVPVPNALPPAQKAIASVAANAALGGADVVFVGDSITQLWSTTGISDWNQYFAPLNSLNAGVAGDTTENVLWRLDSGNLAGIAPKLAVLMIGVNDWPDGPSDVAAGVTAVVSKLQHEFPGIRVLLLGILPGLQPAAGSFAREEIAAANELIQPLADGQHVWFLDVGSHFLNSDGSVNTALYETDDVHPNAEGYDVLAQAIAPWVEALS